MGLLKDSGFTPGLTPDDTKVTGCRIRCMERGLCTGPMVADMKGSTPRIGNMEMENLSGQILVNMRVVGKMGSKMELVGIQNQKTR